MAYEDLRKQLNELRRQVSKLKGEKQKCETELSSISSDRENASLNYQNSYKQKALQAKATEKSKKMKPFEDKIAELNKNMTDLNNERQRKLDSISADKLEEKINSQTKVMNEIRASSDELQQAIEEVLGKRFAKVLSAQLDQQELDVSPDKFDELINYFSSCASEISALSKRSDKIGNFLNGVQSVIMQIDGDKFELDHRAQLAITVAVLVVVILLFKFVYPFYVLLICLVMVLNLRRNYKILKISLIHETVKKNLQSIEDSFHKQVLDVVEKKQKEINDTYRKKQAQVKAQVDKVTAQMARAATEFDNTFQFDATELKKTYELSMSQKSVREDQLNDRIHEIDVQIDNNYKAQEEIKRQIDEVIGSLQAAYIDPNRIGTEYVFDNKFFIDVKDKKPEFFLYPTVSAVFIYDSLTDVNNFMKLINLQLRAKLNPTVFNVCIYDSVTMGFDLLKFKPIMSDDDKDSSALKRIFKIVTTEEEFRDCTKEWSSELTVRLKDVCSEFAGIEEYNKFMLSIDSLTIPYLFNFLLNVTPDVLTKNELVRVLETGGKVGIYTAAFIERGAFIANKNGSKELLNHIEKFYVLESAGPKSRAKDFIDELLEIKK